MTRLSLSALLAGLLFGFGLLVSGMGNPAKVLAFLDLAGAWDPSLALVMVGAIVAAFPAFHWARRQSRALLGDPMQIPERRDLDPRLVMGSLGFGVGWGLAGFCPGPAIMALGAGKPEALVFVLAMAAGMGVFELIEGHRHPARNAPPQSP